MRKERKTKSPATAEVQRVGYTIPEAAAALGIGRTRFYGLINEGAIQVLRIGRRVVVPVEALERFAAGGAA